VSDFNWLK